MANTPVVVLDGTLYDIADAIRAKTGGTADMTPSEMPAQIASIPSGGGSNNNWADVYSGETTEVYDGDITSLKIYGLMAPSSSYTYITGVNFPNLIEIDTSSFASQDKLTNFNLPKLKIINGRSCFSNCSGYTEIKLPSLDTLLDTGSEYIFQYNTNAIKIDLGNNQSSISGKFGANMFRYNTNLKALILRWNNVATITASTVLRDTGIASGTGYIYVPSNLVNSYKSATYYSTYANQIRAIEDYSVDGTIEGNIIV